MPTADFNNIASSAKNSSKVLAISKEIRPQTARSTWRREFQDLPGMTSGGVDCYRGGVLRFYREEGYLDRWKEAEIRLKTLSDHLSAEQREFLNYEGFLQPLPWISQRQQRLENWRPTKRSPD